VQLKKIVWIQTSTKNVYRLSFNNTACHLSVHFYFWRLWSY